MEHSNHNAENPSELSLIDLLTILVLQRRFIAVCMLTFVMMGIAYAFAIKTPTFTANANMIANTKVESGVTPETLNALAQDLSIKQPLSEALKKGGFITDRDIVNELDGIYTTSLNSKTGQVQLTLRLDNATAAQKFVNDTAQRIIETTKRMQLSETSQKLGKLISARERINQEITRATAATDGHTSKLALMTYAIPIATLESSIIVQGGEPQLVQKMQEEVVNLLQSDKAPSNNSQQLQDQFMLLYKTQVRQNLDHEIAALRLQEQSLVVTIPADLPKKADKPGRSLIVLLFILCGMFVSGIGAFIRHGLQLCHDKPEWQRFRQAWHD